MRRIALAVLLLLCFGFAEAQEENYPKNLIKFSPEKFTFSTFELTWEHFKSADKSFNLYMQASTDALWHEYTGGLLGVEFKKYAMPFGRSKKGKDFSHGFYGSLFLQGGYYQATEDGYYYNSVWDPNTQTYVDDFGYTESDFEVLSVFPGITVGYQRTFWNVLFFEAYVGGGIRFGEIKPDGNANNYYFELIDYGYRGVLPKVGMRLGMSL